MATIPTGTDRVHKPARLTSSECFGHKSNLPNKAGRVPEAVRPWPVAMTKPQCHDDDPFATDFSRLMISSFCRPMGKLSPDGQNTRAERIGATLTSGRVVNTIPGFLSTIRPIRSLHALHRRTRLLYWQWEI
jgi:hypothetical protein